MIMNYHINYFIENVILIKICNINLVINTILSLLIKKIDVKSNENNYQL